MGRAGGRAVTRLPSRPASEVRMPEGPAAATGGLRQAGGRVVRLDEPALRVAMVVTRSDIVGGASVHVRDLCRGLAARGIATTVVVGGEGPYLDDLARHGVDAVRVPSLDRAVHPLRDAAAFAALRRILARLRPDVVATHTAKAGALGRAAAASLGLPAVHTPHGWPFEMQVAAPQVAAWRVAERLLARLPATLVDVSEHERDRALAAGVGRRAQHTVVHNGVPDVGPALRADPAADPPRLVMVARFEAQKDHAALLRALARLARLPWSADLVGDGPLEPAARAQVRAAGLADRVRFLGARTDVPRILAAAQVAVLTTRWESLPLAVLEAMRAGLPVVATAVGGIPEAVDDGVSGLLVPPGDDIALVAALRRVLDDPALRASMGVQGRRRYLRRFTHSRMLDDVEARYRHAAGKPRAVHP